MRLDRVRGGRQKYRRSTDPYIPVKTATLEGNVFYEVPLLGSFFFMSLKEREKKNL